MLNRALARNLFGTVDESTAAITAMVDYMHCAAERLADQPATELLDGDVRFPSPAGGGADAVAAELAGLR